VIHTCSETHVFALYDKVDDFTLYHGEREDSEACLCGHPSYLTCPDWLAGTGTILDARVELGEDGRIRVTRDLEGVTQ
jgi:hypothetical protein